MVECVEMGGDRVDRKVGDRYNVCWMTRGQERVREGVY